MVCKFCGGRGRIVLWEEDSSSQAISDSNGDSTVLEAPIPSTDNNMANDDKLLSICSGGGTLHQQVPMEEDISVLCKQYDSQESKLLSLHLLMHSRWGKCMSVFHLAQGKTPTRIICVSGGCWSMIKFIPYQVLTLRPRNRCCTPFGSQGRGHYSMSSIPFYVRHSTRQRVSNRCNIVQKRLSKSMGNASTLHQRQR
jgi:hypothetical protein